MDQFDGQRITQTLKTHPTQPVRLTNYATVGTSVDDLVLDERGQSAKLHHGRKLSRGKNWNDLGIQPYPNLSI
jgi:hypothetical protein